MTEPYTYTEKDYQDLQEALDNSNRVSCGRPDQYQYYQNELSKAIANFLLLPFWDSQKNEESQE